MVRTIAITLALVVGSATAGEPTDCFNDELDPDTRYTSTEPEILRVTDADISAMLERIREHENRAVASAESESAILAGLGSKKPASN